ncbi:MAG: DUF1735 and LamG domain-containing protein [Cytophagales bacterium]|nr:DUF1735 and LamG domain-containing protein [Cytophagales bacterium]
MKRLNLYLLLFLATMLWSCQESDESFDNKAYLDKRENNEIIYFKKGVADQEKDLIVKIAKPEEKALQLNVNVKEHLVSNYNAVNGENAIILPQENFEILNGSVKIETGAVESEKMTINFKNLGELDRSAIYVLPVEITADNLDVLASKSTYFFVFKEATLISDVANISENYLRIHWNTPEVCNNLTELTFEALIRAKSLDKLISTVMGIEGYYLLRIGDAGWPSNQIQLAGSDGKYPKPNEKMGLPINEWVHIALTHNLTDNLVAIYVNGVKQSEGTWHAGSSVDLARSSFFIGRSYDNNRYLDGEICEVRIWNKIRTAQEIAENPYYVDPSTEGLVAYWKFDDKSDKIVKDHTGNGNDAEAKEPLIWVPVELPSKSNK